ncbi:MAG: hypothetical protein HWE34_15220 [Methylocystaceae bacterium]|nr:hypothetical protein [Methylocystaceae bacterium]
MSNARPALRFSTPVPLSTLEAFLDKECASEWKLKLEGIAEDLNQKVVVISFGDQQDMSTFKAKYPALKKQHTR